MKKILVFILGFSLFNFSFCNEMDIKINKLKEENVLTIKDEVAHIKKSEWIIMSKNERINFLEALNKRSRGREEKNIIIIVDIDTGEELAKIGVFGIEV